MIRKFFGRFIIGKWHVLAVLALVLLTIWKEIQVLADYKDPNDIAGNK